MMPRRRALLVVLVTAALAPLSPHAQPAILKDAAGAPPEARRSYDVDGVEVRLAPPEGLTDEELTAFLRALHRGAIVWKDTRLEPRVIRLRDVDFVGVSESPRRYHVFVIPQTSVNTTYVYAAEFDGTTITIARSSLLKR